MQKTGVLVSAEAQGALLAGNTFAGLERDVVYMSADDSSVAAS